MTAVTLIAVLVAFFALAIGLVRVLGRLIEGDGARGNLEELPVEVPDPDRLSLAPVSREAWSAT
jgi:hypothetical protein